MCETGFLCLHPELRSVLAMGPVKKEPAPPPKKKDAKKTGKTGKTAAKAEGQTPSSKKTVAAKAKNKR